MLVQMKEILFMVLMSISLGSQIGKQESLAVTIYNDNFAMVKDVREITFDEGESVLYFTDVSANIQTQTVTFKALTNPQTIRVYEQNFQKNLVNTNSILKKYIQKQIKILVKLGEMVRQVKGILLGYNSGYIIKTNEGINVYNDVAGIQFPSLPEGFFTTPTLNWKVWSKQARTSSCEVAYRTTGFKWKADYSINLNQNETKGDLGGWVTIDNNSGKRYIDAKLKLIAGDVNTVKKNKYNQNIRKKSSKSTRSAPTFSEKSFADYHLYTLSSPVSLNEASQKQVQFIPKVYSLPIWKYHEIRINVGGYSQTGLSATNKINFENAKKHGLGIPFPKGIVRVFKQDEEDGSLQFIGEDSIDHTPKDQSITLTTGNAFDIVADKYSQQRQKLDGKGSYKATLNMTIKNRKQVPSQIIIIFNNYYADDLQLQWLENDVELEKKTSTEYRWRKKLEPQQIWQTKWIETYHA